MTWGLQTLLEGTWVKEAPIGVQSGFYIDPGYIEEGYFEGDIQDGPIDSNWMKQGEL